jgi:hypothetical protein
MVSWGRFDGWVLVLILVVLSTAYIMYSRYIQLRPVDQISARCEFTAPESGELLRSIAFVPLVTRRSQSTVLSYSHH